MGSRWQGTRRDLLKIGTAGIAVAGFGWTGRRGLAQVAGD